MIKLTEDEILTYIKDEDKSTGVCAITREMLESIDLDNVREIVRDGEFIKTKDGQTIYRFDRFTPAKGSYCTNPSFGGRQILIGRSDRKLYFSDGNWFASS